MLDEVDVEIDEEDDEVELEVEEELVEEVVVDVVEEEEEELEEVELVKLEELFIFSHPDKANVNKAIKNNLFFIFL